MADYSDCIRRLEEAAGRKLSDKEVADIYARLNKAARDIKAGRSADGKQQNLDLGEEVNTAGGAWQAAAARAAKEMEQEAAQADRAANLQAIRMAARQTDLRDMVAHGMPWLGKFSKVPFLVGLAGRNYGALDAIFTRDYSGRVNIESVEQAAEGVRSLYKSRLMDTWTALGNQFIGMIQDQGKLRDLLTEMRGEDSGNPEAKKGAEAWLKVAEAMRQRFNQAGGVIGKLVDWGFPQHHSQEHVAAAGQENWIKAIWNRLDRDRYVDDMGVKWDDGRLTDFLKAAWATIATNGHANIEPGEAAGFGKRANRHAEERQIHFKSAQDYLDYWKQFGDRTPIEILNNHVDTMAKDIAFIEKLGPNPDMTYRYLRDEALREASIAQPTFVPEIEGRIAKIDSNYNYWAGKTVPSYNPTISKVAETVSNLNTAGKLGGAALASFFGDKPMMEAVSTLNHLPMLQRWRTEMHLLNPLNVEDRRQLQIQGLMLESVRSGMLRFNEGLGSSSTTGLLANGVMKITGMTAINDIRKSALGVNLMSAIGNQIKNGKEFGDLHNSDVRLLRNYGITEADWNTWKLAKPWDFGYGNDHALTPEGITQIPDQALKDAGLIASDASPEAAQTARDDAIIKLLGAVNTESDFGIVQPGWRERAQFYSNLQRGTFFGEISRAALQFKAFPWAQFQRGLDAVVSSRTMAGKAMMTAWIMGSTTLLGAMLMQTRDMLTGKDPRDMTGNQGQNKLDLVKFWGAALIQGGALGIYGDFLYGANQTRMGMGPLEAAAGPSVGPAIQTLEQALNYIAAKSEGKPTHLAAETMQDIKGFVPGNNIWYTRAIIDHLFWQWAMEQASPGYSEMMRQSAMKNYHQDWYAPPGHHMPERGPDFSKTGIPQLMGVGQ